MSNTFLKAVEHRRSIYGLSKQIHLADSRIETLVETVLLHTPSPFNSQSTRIVLLLGPQHDRFWELVKTALAHVTTPEKAAAAKAKIEGAFQSGYGTALFYEDQDVVEGLQNSFPAYADKFPHWSQHTNAMHQFALWTLLEDEGLGASLQHYNPLIDAEVARTWGISPRWSLVAQMPFGAPVDKPGEKTFEPIEKRLKVFK